MRWIKGDGPHKDSGPRETALVCANCPNYHIAAEIQAALSSRDKRERRAARVARDIVKLSGCKAPFDPLDMDMFEPHDLTEKFRQEALLNGNTIFSAGTDLYPSDEEGDLPPLQEEAALICRNLHIESAERVLKIARGIIDLQDNWNAGEGL